MKAEHYVDYLSSLEFFGCEPGNTVFMQDHNDPKHQAKVTMKWLKDHNNRCLDWPSQFPYLNPVCGIV